MDHLAVWVLVVGLAGTAVGLALAGKRVVFLFRMITHGQPAPDRIEGVTGVHSSFELRRVVDRTNLPLEHISDSTVL